MTAAMRKLAAATLAGGDPGGWREDDGAEMAATVPGVQGTNDRDRTSCATSRSSQESEGEQEAESGDARNRRADSRRAAAHRRERRLGGDELQSYRSLNGGDLGERPRGSHHGSLGLGGAATRRCRPSKSAEELSASTEKQYSRYPMRDP